MSTFQVESVYTPDDSRADRRRTTATFSTDRIEINDIAMAACVAVFNRAEDAKPSPGLVKLFEDSDAADQISDQDTDCFSFVLFTNNGEYELSVEEN